MSVDTTPDTSRVEAQARAIHERVFVVDTHIDIPVTFLTPPAPGTTAEDKLVSWERFVEGGLDCGGFAVYTANGPFDTRGYDDAYAAVHADIAQIHATISEMSEQIGLARTPDDVARLRSENKKVAFIGLENGYCIGEDLSRVQTLFDKGVRYITATHGEHNQFADSTTYELGAVPKHNGLSDIGKELVREMNRLGIMIDVTHISLKALMDSIEISTAPVIGTHSGVRGVCNVARNVEDENLYAIKENGGVLSLIGINDMVREESPEREAARLAMLADIGFPTGLIDFFEAYFSADDAKQREYHEGMAALEADHPRGSVQDFIDHVDYAVNLIGPNHIGLSADFFMHEYTIRGWEHMGLTANLTIEMVKRGYSEEDIAKIWGGNFLRVWQGATDAAESTPAG